MKKNSKEIISGIIVALLITLMTAVFYLTYYLSNKVEIKLTWIWLPIIYITTSCTLLLISLNYKNKKLQLCVDIYLTPLFLVIAIAGILLPMITLLFQYSLYLMISFVIPGLILKILSYFQILILPNELKIYIIFTSAVFIAVLFNGKLRKFVQWLSSLYTKNYSFAKNAKLNALTDYVASQNIIKFLIYSIYVILLIVMNIHKLQGRSLYNNTNYDVAILQSFVTFLAFDKVHALSAQLDFKFSNLLSLLIYSIKSLMNFNIEEKNKQEESKK
ncbi:hypothetical protein [Chryseobacterium soldanellicola]|uniref:hypothetical protein n=1 Tax=Chryseobacterium soldanellicola TaxID=311333 RepID=UPI000B7E73BD|nr:hypothetical protein [Chryseobacterium soldanellicola]